MSSECEFTSTRCYYCNNELPEGRSSICDKDECVRKLREEGEEQNREILNWLKH